MDIDLAALRALERERGAAKGAFGHDPADMPVRPAAAGAVVLGIGAIDDVVPALRQPAREARRRPLVDLHVRDGLHCVPAHPRKARGECLQSDYRSIARRADLTFR